MLQGSVIRTLLYKELLRYRYNWGLLAMAAALLALAGLVSLSARLGRLPGQNESSVQACYLLYDAASDEARAWANHLRRHRLPPNQPIGFWHSSAHGTESPTLPPRTMAIELLPPSVVSGNTATKTWRAYYWCLDDAPAGVQTYRDWFGQETHRFLGTQPRLEEQTHKALGEDTTDRVPLIVTALVIFALYLLSFNLYITSTGEEREKRILLALLLTPASPAAVLTAKAIFYATASLALALAVVALHDPILLTKPLLWSTVVMGSVGYVAIGTIVLSAVRRQTTLSTVSLLYLIATSIIMLLSEFLPAFRLLRYVLIENYLHRQLHRIISDQPAANDRIHQIILASLVAIWVLVALAFFERKGMAIAKAR